MSPSNSSDTKKELGTNTTFAGQASRRECVACMVSVRGDWGPGLGAGRGGPGRSGEVRWGGRGWGRAQLRAQSRASDGVMPVREDVQETRGQRKRLTRGRAGQRQGRHRIETAAIARARSARQPAQVQHTRRTQRGTHHQDHVGPCVLPKLVRVPPLLQRQHKAAAHGGRGGGPGHALEPARPAAAVYRLPAQWDMRTRRAPASRAARAAALAGGHMRRSPA